MRCTIINLTQHAATAEQIADGVRDLPAAERGDFIRLLTVDELPTSAEIVDRCHDISLLASHNGLGDDDDPLRAQAMIGGAPWMMRALEEGAGRGWHRAHLQLYPPRVSGVSPGGR